MSLARIAALGALFLVPAVPAAADPAVVSPDTVARAKAAYAQLESGTIDRSSLTPALSAAITADTLASFRTRLESVGEARSFTAIEQTDVDGVTTAVFRLHCPGGLLDYTFGISDTTNKIAKLYFVPGPSS